MIQFPRLAARIFGEPLAIERGKLDIIITAVGPRLQGMPMDDPEEVMSRAPMDVQSGIAVIDISGTLVAKTSGMGALSGLTSYADIAADFSASISNPAIRGIVLDIDSPGGEVKGMLELGDAIYSARGVKPICAVTDCAASAAFLLASAADQIIVSRTGLTGSVGIIAMHLDESAADEKAGLKYTAIYAGARKLDGSEHFALTPEARDEMQARVDKVYGMFVAAVARNLGMTEDAVRKTDAAVYMGQAGVDVGFASAVGSIDDAVGAVSAAIRRGDKKLLAISNYASSAASAARKEPTMADTTTAEVKTPTEAEIKEMIEKAKAEGFGAAAEIHELCAIAGMPERAAGFIKEKKPVAEIRTALLAAKVEEDEKAKLNPNLLPGGAKGASEPAGKAEPWGKVLKAVGVRTKGGN